MKYDDYFANISDTSFSTFSDTTNYAIDRILQDKTLIIDAKYYSHTMQHHFDSNTFHSANMYQIFTYVKNFDKEQSGDVSGMLLYAHTNEAIQPDNDYVICGNKISVKTLNLNCEFEFIRNQLDNIMGSFL